MAIPEPSQNKVIRRDIEGLRAIAVLSVILYHFDIGPISGGFVGVDIFFVISGYLISHQIKSEIARGSFSIIAFYERRIRRILPALYGCLITSYVAAYFILYPPEMEAFSRSVFATVGFFANFHFWKAYQNYFAPTSELAPLLHTWSLAVEEQFYFLAPAILIVLSRIKRILLLSCITIGLLVSLGLAEWMIDQAPSLVFFFTPARAWELLFGTIIAFEPRLAETFRYKSQAIWLGALCLLTSIFFFYPGIRFPGLSALLPVIGVAIIVAFGKHVTDHPVIKALSIHPLTFIGLLSYSLYLWHWPILVFTKLQFGENPSWLMRLMLLGSVVAIAAFFFLLIEQPIRRRKFLSTRGRLLTVMASVSLIILSYAYYDSMRGGIAFKSPQLALKLETPADQFDMRCFSIGDLTHGAWNKDECRLTQGAGQKILLWGDSTAAHYAHGIKKIAPAHDATVYLYAMSACLPVFPYETLGRPYCRQFNSEMPAKAKEIGIEKIVMAGRWDTAYRSHVKIRQIADTIQTLEKQGFQVEILAATPIFKRDLRSSLWDRVAAGGSADEGFAVVDQKYNEWLIHGLSPRRVIDPIDHLCGQGPCPYRLRGEFLFSDGIHLSRFGSEYAVQSYFPF